MRLPIGDCNRRAGFQGLPYQRHADAMRWPACSGQTASSGYQRLGLAAGQRNRTV